MIAMTMGAVLGVGALNWIVVNPLLESRDQLDAAVEHAKEDLATANRMIVARPRYTTDWNNILDQGLTDDFAAAQALLLDNLAGWIQQSNLTLKNISPGGTPQQVTKPGGKPGEKMKGFMRITCKLVANGAMAQIVDLVRSIQSAGIPVRINEMSISAEGTSPNGTNDLLVTLGVSTIYLVPDTVKPGEQPPSPTSRPASRPAQLGRGAVGNSNTPATGPSTRRDGRS
jgi:hypothetical protein